MINRLIDLGRGGEDESRRLSALLSEAYAHSELKLHSLAGLIAHDEEETMDTAEGEEVSKESNKVAVR